MIMLDHETRGFQKNICFIDGAKDFDCRDYNELFGQRTSSQSAVP